MDRLKEEFRNLPDPQAPRYQQTLRRDLLAAMQPRPNRGLKAALAGTGACAALLAALVVAFVVSPALPQQLHTAWLDSSTGESAALPPVAQDELPATGQGPFQQAVLKQFLEQSAAGVRRDQDFLETWYSERARPTRVKAVREERILAIRQFELVNGERVAVLTDLGAASQSPTVTALPAATSGRTY